MAVPRDESETLMINRSGSRCGNCHRGADPQETHHLKVLSYSEAESNQPGCGVKWRFITSPYTRSKASCQAMRPDLEWVGLDF